MQFFYIIAEFIRVCVESQVVPFEKRFKQYGEKGNKSAFYAGYARDVRLFQGFIVGVYINRQTIFKISLRILAHFSLFRDIATMYNVVDKKPLCLVLLS